MAGQSISLAKLEILRPASISLAKQQILTPTLERLIHLAKRHVLNLITGNISGPCIVVAVVVSCEHLLQVNVVRLVPVKMSLTRKMVTGLCFTLNC